MLIYLLAVAQFGTNLLQSGFIGWVRWKSSCAGWAYVPATEVDYRKTIIRSLIWRSMKFRH